MERILKHKYGIVIVESAAFTFKPMRNGTKLRHLLMVCDIYLTMDDDGKMILTTTTKSSYGTRRKEGSTFSIVLDKAYRHMLKDLKEGTEGDD